MAEWKTEPIGAQSWRLEDGHVRCFLFEGSERALLVDSGMTPQDLRGMVAGLTQKPVLLVNTHADPDHIANNAQFEEVLMHPAEYAHYYTQRGQRHPVQPVWDGDVIELGGRSFEVIAVPGHTPGSIALLDRQERFVLGGDGVQNGGIFLFGPHRSLHGYLCGLQRLQMRAAGFDTVYPSHGDFPQPASLIGQLIKGTEAVLRGEVSGSDAQMHGQPIKVYDIGAARFFCNPDGVDY